MLQLVSQSDSLSPSPLISRHHPSIIGTQGSTPETKGRAWKWGDPLFHFPLHVPITATHLNHTVSMQLPSNSTQQWLLLSMYLSIYDHCFYLSLFFREREVMESAIQTMVKVFLKSSKGRESLGKKEFQNLVSSQLGNILTVRKSLLKSQNCCLYLDYVIILNKSRQWCCVSPGQP